MKSALLTKSLLAAAALALGTFGSSAFAQTATTAAAPAVPVTGTGSPDPTDGLLGTRYVGVDYGYLRFDQPRGPHSGHEFDAYFNQPLQPGLDFTASASDVSAGYFGTRPRTDQLLAGLTAYQPVNSWFKPFISGQAGIAFNRDAELFSSSGVLSEHNSYDNFDYVLGAGAEFQVLPALVVTPFATYQEIHQFSHDWEYGAKVSYRIVPRVSVSFTPEIDQHHNLGYLTGVNFHF